MRALRLHSHDSTRTDVAASLLYHGYVLAMANLNVILDYPLLAVPSMDRFRDMVS